MIIKKLQIYYFKNCFVHFLAHLPAEDLDGQKFPLCNCLFVCLFFFHARSYLFSLQ